MALKCEEIRDRFSALWEKELNPSEEAEVRRHLEDCPDCRQEFAGFDKTLWMLHSVEEAEVPEGFLSGIYEKMEERREKGHSPGKTPGEGHAFKWKLPLQAVAMVAIVFLALYLTKMMPGELPRKVTEESKPSLDERKGPVEIKTPVVKEEKSDRGVAYKESEKAENKEVSGRLSEKTRSGRAEKKEEAVATEAPRGSMQSAPRPAAAPPPEEYKSDAGLANKPTEGNKVEGRAEGKGSGASRTPQPAPTKAKELEKSLMAERMAPGSVPLQEQELVVRSSDQKKSLLQLHELVKRFGGEILTTEKNALMVSLPRSSLPEFKKELEGIRAPAKARQAVSSKAGAEGVSEKRAKGEGPKEKDKEIHTLDSLWETRAVIRIVLSEE